jgi:hypothetical protein
MLAALTRVIDELTGDWQRTVEYAFAMVAIALAYVHAYHLRHQVKEVGEIKKWLPTQPIGSFPTYLTDIVRLVKSARKYVVIMCDYPAYGVFSDPDAFFLYCQTLVEQIHNGVRVSLTCLDDKQRSALTNAEFARYANRWPAWCSNNASNIRTLLRHHNKNEDLATAVTREQLVEMLSVEDFSVLLNTLQNASRVTTVCETLPVYFWLIDGREAIFSIPSVTNPGDERGFYTRDADLIAGLIDIHSRATARETTELSSASVA